MIYIFTIGTLFYSIELSCLLIVAISRFAITGCSSTPIITLPVIDAVADYCPATTLRSCYYKRSISSQTVSKSEVGSGSRNLPLYCCHHGSLY